MSNLITKESLAYLLSNRLKKKHIVGNALVAILVSGTFTQPDSIRGPQHANYYLKNNRLREDQVEMWMKLEDNYPHICKYADQLNKITERQVQV